MCENLGGGFLKIKMAAATTLFKYIFSSIHEMSEKIDIFGSKLIVDTAK